jgi:drug/metabolite transporter (DMT)-like permease
MFKAKLLPDGRIAYYPFGNWDGRIAPSSEAIDKVINLRIVIGVLAFLVLLPSLTVFLNVFSYSTKNSLKGFDGILFLGLWSWITHVAVNWKTADWPGIVDPFESRTLLTWKSGALICLVFALPLMYLIISRPSFTLDNLILYLMPLLIVFVAAGMMVEEKRRAAWRTVSGDSIKKEHLPPTFQQTPSFQHLEGIYKKL